MFMMVRGSCAAPKATCGFPPPPSNCIRTHLGEYDGGPGTADRQTVDKVKTTAG